MALGMLSIGAIISMVSIGFLYHHLNQDQRQQVILAAQTKSQALEPYFWQVRAIAEQVSRGNTLEISSLSLGVDSTDGLPLSSPLRVDVLEQAPKIAGLTRIDRQGEVMVQLGMKIPQSLWPKSGEDSPENISFQPVQVGNPSYLLVTVPRFNPPSPEPEEMDLFLFTVSDIERILQEFVATGQSLEIALARVNNARIDRLLPFLSYTDEQGLMPLGPNTRLLGLLHEKMTPQRGVRFQNSPVPGLEAVAVAPIQNSNWVVLLQLSSTHVEAGIQQIQLLGAVTVVLLLLGSGLITLLLYPLARPILIHADQLEQQLQANMASLERELQERKRTERLLAAHARESAVIAGLGQWALAGMEVMSLIEAAAAEVIHTLDSDCCCLWELLPDCKALALKAGAGFCQERTKAETLEVNAESQVGYTLLANEPILSPDFLEETRFTPSPFLLEQGIASGITVLVHGQREPYGVLAAYSTERHQFDLEDLHFLQAIANVLAAAIDRQKRERALCESEERYALAVAGANDGLWDWNLITNRVYFSPRWKSLLGYQVENGEKISEHNSVYRPEEWFSRVHPDDIDPLKQAIADHLAGVTPHFTSEHRILDVQGQYRWMLSRGLAVRDREGNPYRMAGSQTDISDRKATEEANIRLAAFPKYNPNPVLACDFQGEIVYVNPATERVLEELCLGLATGFLPMNHRELVVNSLNQGKSGWQVERFVQDRLFYWLYHPIPSLNIVHIHVMDITDRQNAQDTLRHEALHDSLTGLPNRALFLNRLTSALTRAKIQRDYQFAVIFLDLDRFKVVNDSLGHFIGDCLLVALAKRLQNCVGSGDILARFGGDEFTILVEHIPNIQSAIKVAKKIQTELISPFNLKGYEVFTSASMGIAPSTLSYEHPEDLLRDADIAMYRAKARGKARYEVFDKKMLENAVAQLTLENDLRRSILKNGDFPLPTPVEKSPFIPKKITKPVPDWVIPDPAISEEKIHRQPNLERSEFLLHYQPIVALDTGLLSGFEALVRWQHPERGLVFPGEFIPVAEETGLILSLGEWVLREACLQMQQWHEQFKTPELLSISVNLSGQQLGQPDLLERIDRILAETHLNPSSLKLEITESVLMENAALAAELLEKLRSRNIHLCIDDFGTGYSSLSHLAQFPINTLKIDKSFVMGMDGDNESSEIVRAIATLAHNLGMYVTAEGVEKEQHLVQLWSLHCDYGQGYFFSRGLDRVAAQKLLEQSPRW
ncbi:PAS domain S-box/diguanylate cyclase (GGDEF) domain-containing protein [Oscillatoria acuminata PCC 6304]|uniref:PAS domain S-box/diguanylate cyclase (GGDEF) domain-containing protein n=2 Tax=Oscillatoria acuminata TaxID=118323 RepID=K9TLC3_9CYAN|nr:PAS domain S-box/diguanylate cyclase (GGDEF) domain-containing protein [Oscillatoria acuminata PCC 6304]